jgi:hypothetical protein
MDEEDKKILHDYIEKHFRKKLDAPGKQIAGMQLILAIVIAHLHRADVLPTQRIKSELEEMAKLFSADPESHELERMARA